MKKIALIISSLLVVGAAQAQDAFKVFKPSKGDVTTELGLSGGLLNTTTDLTEGALLKGRYFTSNNSAIRVGLNISSDINKENFYQGGTSANKGILSESETSLQLNLGYEYHFKGTNRLSPYVGGDLLLGNIMNKTTGDNTDGMDFVNGYDFESKNSAFGWGIRGVIGADYYFVKNVYLGVEAGWGFMNTIGNGGSLTITDNGVSNTTDIKSPGSSFTLTPSVTTGVRIGFVF